MDHHIIRLAILFVGVVLMTDNPARCDVADRCGVDNLHLNTTAANTGGIKYQEITKENVISNAELC